MTISYKESSSFLVFFLFLPYILLSQIGGISASKVAAYCVTPVGDHMVEFEPSFSIATTNQFWNEDGEKQNSFASTDSVNVSSGLSWRISYGLWDKFEVGISFSPDLSSFSWGAKMTVLEEEKMALSLMTGLNTPFGNRTYNKRTPTADDVKSYGLGIINSWAFDETLSFDINLQFQDYFKKVDGVSNRAYFLNADIGKYVSDGKLLLIAGIGYQQSDFSAVANQSKWTFYPGISIEWGANFLVVLNGAFDIIGKNMQKTNGFGVALTTTIR